MGLKEKLNRDEKVLCFFFPCRKWVQKKIPFFTHRLLFRKEESKEQIETIFYTLPSQVYHFMILHSLLFQQIVVKIFGDTSIKMRETPTDGVDGLECFFHVFSICFL